MALEYYLVKNNFVKQTTDEKVAVVNQNRVTEKELVDHMLKTSKLLPEIFVNTLIIRLMEAVVYFVKQGRGINTSFFRINLSIKGKFNGKGDQFDPKRHKINITFTPGKEFIKLVGGIEVKKVEPTIIEPFIKYVEDVRTNLTNKVATKGNWIFIRGSRLKFDEKDSHQGVFFINNEGQEYKSLNVPINNPSELLAATPSDIEGHFYLEVRTIRPGRKILQVARFQQPLNIVELED
ncbi:DNA-binding domain-containing protein [Thermophagus sp. OGC60D27]|uniref:DNA-binding domain-containing protein n=1 Tax=Thermophagus sp. OGC60D27 TaxID=3458415 RepID=UPI004037D4B5